jgi:hypothetical protein
MLEEQLDKFADDETGIEFNLNLGMSMENPVVQHVDASAIRLDDVGESTTAVSIRGYFNDIQRFHRDDVLSDMDDVAAGLEELGTAAFRDARETASSHIFAIETIEAHGREKGSGLALILLGATIEALSSGRVITAVLKACPFYPERMSAAELAAARKKLFAHWSQLGFRRVTPRSNYMVLVADNYVIPERAFGVN